MRKSFHRFRRTFDTLRSRARIRRDHQQLRELPDYLLRDVGLNRSDITACEGMRPLTQADRWGTWG